MTIVAQKPMPVNPRRRKEPLPVLAGATVSPCPDTLREQTAPLSWDNALAFKSVLDRFGFEDVQVIADLISHAFRVRFVRPVSLINSLRDRRLQRGVEQFAEMQFALSQDAGVYHCVHFYPDSPEDFGFYQTSIDAETCTCPDFQYRSRLTDGLCKHQTSLACFLGRDVLEERAEESRKRRIEANLPSLETTDSAKAERAMWLFKMQQEEW